VELINTLVDQLTTRVEDLWLASLFCSFFTMVCEASKPKPREGESRSETNPIAIWIGIASLLTPILLFLHAFLTGGGALLAVIVAIGSAITLAALIGWAIAALAPDVGRTLSRAAPLLAIAAFGLTVYVTWESVFGFINSLVEGASR
jgi:hypothetical protein